MAIASPEFYPTSMWNVKLISCLYLLVFSGIVFAHAPEEGKIWLSAGPYAYRTMLTREVHDSNSPYFLGGAVIANADIDSNGGVEIALIYMDKMYFRTKDADFVSERIKRMHIVTGYRHWFVDSFSMGGGFYSSYSMGDAVVVEDKGEHAGEHPTSARDITEYGFDLSLQWEFLQYDSWAALVESRYSLAVTAKNHEDADVYGLLLGVKFLVPKQRRENE